MPINAQDPWVTGSALFFRRDPVNTVIQPILDLGVIDIVNPSLEITSIQLEDSRSGKKALIDERVVAIGETYEITCSNLSPENLALMFMASRPSAFTQTNSEHNGVQWADPGFLLQIQDANSEPLLDFDKVAGVIPTTVISYAITSVTVGTKTIITSDDASALNNGDHICISGTTDVDNDGTYTVDAVTGVGPTTITVTETITGADSTGGTLYGAGCLIEGTVWEVVDLDLGMIRLISGGSFSTAANIRVVAELSAIADDDAMRLIVPQGVTEIKGDAMLVYSRNEDVERSARIMRVSLRPSGSAIAVEDYSNFTLTATVLRDTTKTNQFGEMKYFKGATPDKS